MRRLDPNSKRSAAAEKSLDRIKDLIRPAPWVCTHPECLAKELTWVNTGRRTRTVPSPAHVMAAALVLRTNHPEASFPMRAALAWRFGVSPEAIRLALRAARRAR